MSNTASLKKEYAERIAPALKSQFQYSSTMQVPVLKKIVINQGLGMAVADKKIIEVAINEMTAITGQKAVATISRKDIANFKLRKKMPIGVMVTLRRERMYEFLEKLVRVALPRIRDFKGIDIYFRENDLFLNTKGIVTFTIKLTFDTFEVTNTRKSYTNQFFKEFVHSLAT